MLKPDPARVQKAGFGEDSGRDGIGTADVVEPWQTGALGVKRAVDLGDEPENDTGLVREGAQGFQLI